jgi:signal transduction histidine kinase
MEFLLNEERALRKAFGVDNKVEYQIHGEFQVNIDEDTLANILLNMAKNSRVHGNANLLVISALYGGGTVKLSVMDNGIGIDPLPGEENPQGIVTDVLRHRVSRNGGKGLGLSDLKERMWAMGGDVACYGHGGFPSEISKKGGVKFLLSLQAVD